MSVVIIGGNERMKQRYEQLCTDYGCTAKVYTKEKGAIRKKIGSPDLLICFTGTVSHKMVNAAKALSKKEGFPIAHCHSSSVSALDRLLKEKTGLVV